MEEFPIGFCKHCFRVRHIQEVEETIKGVPHGKCTQCVREEMEHEERQKAPCGAAWYGMREGEPDDGCGWGDLCPANDEKLRENYPATCPACRGTGGGVYNDCATCGGNGVV